MDLPQGWRSLQLQSLLKSGMINGRSVPSKQDGFPVLRLTALKTDRVDLSARKGGAWTSADAAPFLVAQDDFFVSRGNGSLSLVGRGALLDQDPDAVAFPDTIIRIRTDPEVIAPRFLALQWNSRSVRSQIEDAARTTAGIYKVNQSILGKIVLAVPSIETQQRIADILEDHLSRLDAADAWLSAGLARTAGLQDRLIKSRLLGDRIVARRMLSQIEPAGVDDGYLDDLPEGWCWRRLGELADVVGGVTKDSKRQSDPEFVEVPYLRVANVQRGRLDLTHIATIRIHPAKATSLRLQPGDVLLNEGGDRDKLARGWVWEGQIDHCIHQNHVFRARVRDDAIEPRLLSWASNTFGAPWADRNGKQSVNLASISLSKIRLMPIPVPPRPLQAGLVNMISSHLDAAELLKTALRSALRRTAMLRKALLDAAFSGRLTGRASDMDMVEETAGA